MAAAAQSEEFCKVGTSKSQALPTLAWNSFFVEQFGYLLLHTHLHNKLDQFHKMDNTEPEAKGHISQSGKLLL